MRVQFELDNDAVKYIDDIKKDVMAHSRAEVVKNALAIFRWAIDKVGQGYRIVAINESESLAKELSLPIFDQMRRAAR